MTRVLARKIVKVEPFSIFCYIEGCKTFKHIYVEKSDTVIGVDMDAVDAQVDDWVVVWPSGAKITYTAEAFSKHFQHVIGEIYDTPWIPLFNASRFTRPIVN